ncbi:MAG: antibiotic biosynthesis monooxygenase [Actinomycetota bacterium]
MWFGRTGALDAEAYADYLDRSGVAELSSTPGNRGVFVLRRVDRGVAHFGVLSLWDSMEAVKAFAGQRPEIARYFPQDDEFLLEKTPTLEHWEIVTTPALAPTG